jgi:hypothetical protein
VSDDPSTRGLRDSGERREWRKGGGQREMLPGKGRFDLLPFHAMTRLATVFEKGAAKYAERNWENGMPLSRFVDSGLRHLSQYMAGDVDEDHLGQALWNIACLIEMEHWIDQGFLPEEYRDIPVRRSVQEVT